MTADLALLRQALWPLSALYGIGVLARNLMFDVGLRHVHRAAVPVVSVGNLAAGGTGKTPLVVWLVQQALRVGLRPGVLARGYGRAPDEDLNDEGKLLARRFPNLAQVQDPDRVRGARQLVTGSDVDLIVLDDGFQHRRLHRDWDLVCVDATRPFAGGVLPVGLLREQPRALRRAGLLVLTRAGGIERVSLERRLAELRAFAGGIPAVATDHVPVRLVEMPSGAEPGLDALRGRRVVLLSGIARPETFAATVEHLGAEIVGHERRRDHHLHTCEEVRMAGTRAQELDALLVTTEKDEVKLAGFATPRVVLELELRFLTDPPVIGSEASTFLSFRPVERT